MALRNQVTTSWHCKWNSKNDVVVLMIWSFKVRQEAGLSGSLHASWGALQSLWQAPKVAYREPGSLNLHHYYFCPILLCPNLLKTKSRHDPISPWELTYTLMQHRAWSSFCNWSRGNHNCQQWKAVSLLWGSPSQTKTYIYSFIHWHESSWRV